MHPQSLGTEWDKECMITFVITNLRFWDSNFPLVFNFLKKNNAFSLYFAFSSLFSSGWKRASLSEPVYEELYLSNRGEKALQGTTQGCSVGVGCGYSLASCWFCSRGWAGTNGWMVIMVEWDHLFWCPVVSCHDESHSDFTSALGSFLTPLRHGRRTIPDEKRFCGSEIQELYLWFTEDVSYSASRKGTWG